MAVLLPVVRRGRLGRGMRLLRRVRDDLHLGRAVGTVPGAGRGDGVSARIEVMSWDWRQQPDMAFLAGPVHSLPDGRVNITEVDTDSDEYAIVISDGPLDRAQAREAWRRKWEGES